jgi:hypothetical protein
VLARGELHERRQESQEPLEQDRAEGWAKQIDVDSLCDTNNDDGSLNDHVVQPSAYNIMMKCECVMRLNLSSVRESRDTEASHDHISLIMVSRFQ